ncbi:hypothetical protein CQ047_11240 [Microbacterium sp. MYb72]|nr:hypothetical protein CQ047_11240 [Microbacterium sp. MYb72]
MDSGWAVILGAIIALVSSAVLPWIRDAVAARRADRIARKSALEASIRRVIHTVTTASFERPLSTPDRAKIEVGLQDTLTEFELLLGGRSQPVGVMLDQASRDATGDDERLRALARSTVPLLLTGWHSGIFSGPDVWARYCDSRAAITSPAPE